MNGRAGFSIIELLVALVVLSLGVMGLANLFPLGARTQVRDRLRTSATDLAQQKMEQLQMVTWSDAQLSDGTHPSVAGETLTLPREGNFNRVWIVATQPGAFSDIKRVTVRVIWTHLAPDSVELVSYFRR